MMTKHTHVRLGATAIAAVLALTSTPLVAQVADPLAPAAETPATEPAPTPAPVETSEPTVTETTTTEAADPTPTPARTTATRTKTTRRIAPAPRAAAPAARSSVPAAAAPAAPPVAAPMAEAPPAPLPPVEAEPVAPVAAPAEPAASNNDLPLMVGGAGLAAVALLGTGIVASRRRRRRDAYVAEEVVMTEPTFQPKPVQQPVAEPVAAERSAFNWGRTPAPAAAAASGDAARQKLPNGFDISRFGRHVQAAYRGPTTDNPSLSLKRRLKRAAFFDMKERRTAKSGGVFARAPQLMPA